MVSESWILGLVLGSIVFESANDLCGDSVSLNSLLPSCELRTCGILGCQRIACHWALVIGPMGLPAARLVKGRA